MPTSMRRSIVWVSLSQGGTFVIQFAGSVVMARLLTPYEMGVYAVAAAAVGLLTALRVFGLGAFLIREPELTPLLTASTFTINAVLSLLVALCIVALSGISATVLGEPGVRSVMLLLALTPAVGIFEMVPSSLLERSGAFMPLAAGYLLKVAITTVTALGFAFHGASYMSIAYGTLAGSLFGVAYTTTVGWRHASVRVGLHDWRRIMRFGLQMLTVTGVRNVSLRLSDMVLGRIVGLGALGLYSRASGLHSLLWDNLHQIVARVVFVSFSEQRRRGVPLRDTYLRTVAIMTALLWPAFAGLGILAGPVILLVYGPEWTGAALPLSLLAVSGMVMVANTMAAELYVVCGETGRQVRYELKRAGAGLMLFVLGCLGGLAWAAAARIAEAVLGLALSRRDVLRMTGGGSGYQPIYAQSALLTVAACGPSAVLMGANEWSTHTPLLPIMAAVVMGVAAWSATLWRLRHPLYDEAGTLARRLVDRRRRS